MGGISGKRLSRDASPPNPVILQFPLSELSTDPQSPPRSEKKPRQQDWELLVHGCPGEKGGEVEAAAASLER